MEYGLIQSLLLQMKNHILSKEFNQVLGKLVFAVNVAIQ